MVPGIEAHTVKGGSLAATHQSTASLLPSTWASLLGAPPHLVILLGVVEPVLAAELIQVVPQHGGAAGDEVCGGARPSASLWA